MSLRRRRNKRRRRTTMSAFRLLRKSLRTKKHETPRQHKRRVQMELERAHRIFCRGGHAALVKSMRE